MFPLDVWEIGPTLDVPLLRETDIDAVPLPSVGFWIFCDVTYLSIASFVASPDVITVFSFKQFGPDDVVQVCVRL